jgi:hypothetical protein
MNKKAELKISANFMFNLKQKTCRDKMRKYFPFEEARPISAIGHLAQFSPENIKHYTEKPLVSILTKQGRRIMNSSQQKKGQVGPSAVCRCPAWPMRE